MSVQKPYYEIASYTELDDCSLKTKISPVMVPHTIHGRTQLHEGILIHNNGIGNERLAEVFEKFQQELKDTGNTEIHAKTHVFSNGKIVGLIYGDIQKLFNLTEANFPEYKPERDGAVPEEMILKSPPISASMLYTRSLRGSYNRLMKDAEVQACIADAKVEFRNDVNSPPQNPRSK